MVSDSNKLPVAGNTALSAIELEASLTALPGWTAAPAAAIGKSWRLPDFRQAMAFANAVAELAERLDHHPELQVGWGRCAVRWTTHDAGGVTARDLDAAHRTDELAARHGARADTAPAA